MTELSLPLLSLAWGRTQQASDVKAVFLCAQVGEHASGRVAVSVNGLTRLMARRLDTRWAGSLTSYRLIFGCLLLSIAGLAQAQIYRCESAKKQVTYSDSPCGTAGRQIVTDIPTSHPAARTDESPFRRDLDAAVRRAISAGNLFQAEQLATTSEHWTWIAEAKALQNKAPGVGRTEADLAAEKGSSRECEQARRSYEVGASTFRQGEAPLDARRTLMYTACGIKEPARVEVDNSQTIVRRPPRSNRQDRQDFQAQRRAQLPPQTPPPKGNPRCRPGMVCR